MNQEFGKEDYHRPEVASEEERRAVFVEWYDHLYWTAFFITGASDSARFAIENAIASSEHAASVFRDWLVRWARNVTAQEATQLIRDAIIDKSSEYAERTCVHAWHDPLSVEEVEILRQIPLDISCAQIDPLARSVLVMRGIHQNSIATCARALGIPRNRISAAYCHAISWLQGALQPVEAE